MLANACRVSMPWGFPWVKETETCRLGFGRGVLELVFILYVVAIGRNEMRGRWRYTQYDSVAPLCIIIDYRLHQRRGMQRGQEKYAERNTTLC